MALLLLFLTPAFSATRTWNGGGANDLWSNSANWGGTAPVAGDDLVFSGTTRLTPNNDKAALTSFNSITFSATAGAFVIGGNSVTLAGGATAITNSRTTGTVTLNLAVTFATAAPAITTVSGGTLTLGGALANGGLLVTVASAGTTNLGGILSGTGGLTTSGVGTVLLSGVNTYSGTTTVSAGTLQLGNGAALGATTAATSVSNGATLDLNGQAVGAEGLTLTGTGVGALGALQNTNSGTPASLSGTVQTGTYTVGGAGNITLSGQVGTGISSTLTKIGNGTLTFTGAADNAYLSLIANAGTVVLAKTSTGANHCLGVNVSGTALTVSGATVQFGGTGGDQIFNSGGIVVNSGTLDMNGTSETIATLSGVGGVVDNTTGVGTYTLTFGDGSSYSYSGGIQNASGSVALVKQGSGTQTLSGTNTYTGTTTVSAGTLNVTGSLGAGSAVTVSSGGTLAGTGTVAGTVTVANGGAVSPGGAVTGTLTTGAQVLNAASVLNMTLSPLAASTDKLAVNGNFTLAGTVNVTAGTAFTFGSYTLATYTGSLTNNTLSVGALPSGYFGTITAGSGVVTLSLLDYSGWNYVSTINFNTTSAGANVATDQTNFPLLVRLDSNNFFFDQAMPDGRDIRFADPDGSPLAYEIERWDATLKKAEVWVLVPQIDGNSDRDFIHFYWGNSSATSQSSSTSTFPTSAGFSGVWHLDEDGNTTAAGYGDATSHAYTGTGTGLSSSSDVSGQVGYGQQFDGSTSYIVVTGTYPTMTAARTLSTWVKSTTPTVANAGIAAYGTYPGGNQAFGLSEWATGKWGSWTDGTNPSGTLAPDQTWHHLVATYDGTTARFYQDGVLAGSSVTALSTTSGSMIFGARMSDKGLKFTGVIDEVEMAAVQRSADWIKLEYENQKTGSTFLAFPNTLVSTFSYGTKVYINTTASGANITSDQSNYPLLVRLTGANFDFTQARSDGGDLRFADSTGALLPYEIERFDAASKLAEVWVSIPTVNGNDNSQWFRMYWGKPTATSLSSGAAVFSAAGGYVGVWHLNEDGGTTALAYKDASGLANNGTGLALTNASDITGMVGTATNFATASNQGVIVPSTGNLHPTGAMTLQAWINSTSQTAFHCIVGRPYTSATSPFNEFDLEYNGTATKGSFNLNLGGTQTAYSTTSTLSTGTWYLLAGVYDGAAQKVYLNGAMESSAARTGTLADYAQPLSIGKYYPNNSNNYDGKVDEVRLSTSARSADWMKLDYETMKAASTVVTVGARTRDYTKSVRLNFNTSATGANVTTNVTNIPILVRLTSSNFDFSVTTNTGNDIQFIDKDGTYLYHEVVEWDKANSTGKVWVKVPQVDGNSTADYITLYYGCATCTASPYDVKDSVWSGYKSVFHLNAPEDKAYDATSLANHGTYFKNQANVAGITGKTAAYFDGSTDYIDIPNESNYDITTMLSVSAWIKVPAFTKQWQALVTKADNTWRISRNGIGASSLRWDCTGLTTNSFITGATSVVDNNWHYVTGTYDGSFIRLYVDGASDATALAATGSISTNNSDVFIGENAGPLGRQWNGAISEVRIGNAANVLGADFIKLSYQNQMENSTLFSATTITTASFQKSKVIKLNTTASGADIPGDVYDYPLLVRINGFAPGTATYITDLTQSAGQDIRFLDGDGVTWLDYQIERWDPAAGVDSAEIWVKVPVIHGNSTSDYITMYYQQAAGFSGNMADGQCASCVFSPANGFAAVWHLNQSGNTTAANYADATGNGSNGTGVAMVAATKVSALSAQGQTFNGSTQYINVPSSGTAVAINNKSFTLSGWFNRTTASANQYGITQGTGVPENGLHFGFRSTNTFTLGIYSDDLNSTGTYAATGTWQYLTGTFDAGTKSQKIYYNGVLENSRTASANYAGTGDMYLARNIWSGSDWFPGTLDEMSVSTVVRDPNWIKLNYQSQRRDATPLFNPSPADFQKTKKLVFNTTKTGANVMNDVVNFPLLVRFTDADGGLLSLVQSGAPDIRFLDGDGKTWLNYQIERWATTTSPDSAEIWVAVPQVDGNSDHDFITMYYQQASGVTVADGQCGSCVFSPSNGFSGVWHLNQAGNNTANNYLDATGNGYHGTGTNMVAGSQVSAMVGQGQTFNGTTQSISAGTTAGSAATQTVSFWINQAFLANVSAVDKNPNDASGVGWTFKFRSTGELWYRLGSESASTDIKATSAYTAGNWAFVTGTFDGSSSANLYINGVLSTSNNSVTRSVANSTTTLRLGIASVASTAERLTGPLDELQISSIVRDSNWVKLTYETQRRTGNQFWNTRTGPDNIASLTATAGSGNIALSWNTPVSDSSNADSVGLWVRFNAYPDSATAAAGASSATKVVRLAKTDSAYSYPATYPGTYYFALAVCNTSGVWSPFTKSASDTANLSGNANLFDTLYVDSATGLDANSCTLAQNPATPKLTVTSALACGASATDTLVVRVMPGTYTDNSFMVTSSKPSQVTGFDRISRPVFAGSGTKVENATTFNYTAGVGGLVTLRALDIRCATNGNNGVHVFQDEDDIILDGLRVYNNGNLKHAYGAELNWGGSTRILITNSLFHQATARGISLFSNASKINILNNVVIGPGTTDDGIYWGTGSTAAADNTFANNILYNCNGGIRNVNAATDLGLVSNNLFFKVTSGSEVVGETGLNSLIKDPLFANVSPTDPNGFKLLPGSPGIDAGTASLVSGGNSAKASTDAFGTSRPVGTAPDIGMYEGSGYTPNPSGEFDTLTTTAAATTLTVENSKWKIIFDKASGGGINAFYDKTTAPATNLLAASSTLFDAKIDAYTASAQASSFAPSFSERSRTRAVVRQRLAVSASLDLNIYYTVYASGHIYIESELANLSSSVTPLAVGTVDYTLKLGTTTAAYTSLGTKNGFGYLTTATRDALLSVTNDLDGGASATETWSTSPATTGSPGTVIFKITDLVDIEKNMKRRHRFLLYVGDNSLDFTKSATLNADAYDPTPLSVSAGSLIQQRSWQDALQGHWTMDDGAGSTARDKAVLFQNDAAITGAGAKFVAGEVGSALYLTATDVATVTDNITAEATIGGTYMFWIKPDFAGSGTTAYIISKGTSVSDGWFVRKVSAQNKITFNMGAASVTSPTLTDGVWTHIAVVCMATGANDLEMYVNGVLVASSTAAATAVANASNLLFGYSAGGVAADKFQGTLDDIRIFKNEISSADIQSIYNQGFSAKYGHYALRADNNNRVVALLNGGAAQTRVQPAFQISNWFGPKTPKYVYLNGTRLTPNTDFVVDSLLTTFNGSYLVLQLNKVLTGADQTLFIDDDDSTGFMGSAALMKTLTISATASDKITIRNFADTVFGSATSGQWHLELDLNGWAPGNYASVRSVDTGFGEFNVWKAAAINPNLAVSSSTNMVGIDATSGRTLTHMKFDGTSTAAYSSGTGYNGPANITYTLADSSSTRLSLVLTNMSMQCSDGTFTLSKRWTVYPTGRIFGSFTVSLQTFDMDSPSLDLQGRYNSGTVLSWGATYAKNKGRWGLMGGDLAFHSFVGGILGVKNLTANYDNTTLNSVDSTLKSNTGADDYRRLRLRPPATQYTSANKPIITNFVMDLSRDYTDSATADSLMADVQTPAVITAITGTRTTTDALDFNTDNFAEGDGAYTYAAAGNIAHFKFVNSVTAFSPAFRINTWTAGTVPEFVILDNQVLTRGYQYNVYLNTAGSGGGELVMQFNKTLSPGNHVFYISHKTGLAVTLRAFEAKGGEGVDTLSWTTESEFENLGYHLYRRLAPAEAQIDSGLSDGTEVAGAGIANALMDAARSALVKRAQAKLAKAQAAASASRDTSGASDTLPSQELSAEELAALGYVRITPKPVPGAKGGSSASTLDYRYIDRTAAYGVAYEYLLEAADFNGRKVQYGPRTARPSNPLSTELYSNYPNPFNPITTLRFSLKEKLKVSLILYDSKGRLVRTLVRPEKAMLPGKYRLIWDARDERGMQVPSGQYFYRFTAGRYVKTRKMILVK